MPSPKFQTVLTEDAELALNVTLLVVSQTSVKSLEINPLGLECISIGIGWVLFDVHPKELYAINVT